MSCLNEINVQIFFLKRPLQPTTITLSSASFLLALSRYSFFQLVPACVRLFQFIPESIRQFQKRDGTTGNKLKQPGRSKNDMGQDGASKELIKKKEIHRGVLSLQHHFTREQTIITYGQKDLLPRSQKDVSSLVLLYNFAPGVIKIEY